MTEPQEQAIAQVQRLLGEHFDACVVTVETKDINDAGDTEVVGLWYGSVAHAIGLHEHEIERLKHNHIRK